MVRMSLCLVVFIILATPIECVAAQDNEKLAVEATVRGFEQANQDFEFAKANSFLSPGAQWIEHSLPEKADELPDWWRKAKTAGVHITFRLHDIDIHVQNDVAWVTLIIDSTFTANNKEGEELLSEQVQGGFANVSANPRELRDRFVESEVLVKTPSGWKIALGHTSLLPMEKK